MSIRYLTAGESHGRALVGIIDGLPSGLALTEEIINADLKRRQGGYGRGGRMKIESDAVQFMSGLRWGRTLGSPLALMIENRDWANWTEGMSAYERHAGSIAAVTRPRPGHADLAGALKYDHADVRNILERSSARETAMRVALGAVAKALLAEFGIQIGSYVREIGAVRASEKALDAPLMELYDMAEASEVRCPDKAATRRIKTAIDKAAAAGDTLGGLIEIFAIGAPVGLGSHVQWDRKLDGRLAQALMSVQAMKAVEVGIGLDAARRPGSEVMDEILPSRSRRKGALRYARPTNNAGGIEGGMSNGMPIVMRATMKPIPTLKKPLRSVDMKTGKPYKAAYERSDVCAVPAASVVCEAAVALALADALVEKFGGDSIAECARNMRSYMDAISKR